MKNYGKLIPFVMVVLMAASWYLLAANAGSEKEEYNKYLAEARRYADFDSVSKAIENYTEAQKIYDSIELRMEVADFYKEQERQNEYIAWCEQFMDKYPKEPRAYEYLLDAYMLDGAYESCYDILYMADKRGVSSDRIKEISEEIAYTFYLDYSNYEDVGIYSNHYSPVMVKGYWGYTDRYGEVRISCKYAEVGAYTQSELTPIVNTEGEAYFIDKSGAKILATKENYVKFGTLIDGVFAAQKENKKYIYINETFDVLFGGSEYDYASAINNGIGTVRNGEEWFIIDADGEKTTEEGFDNIIIDEKEIAYRNERLFVKIDDSYIMVDSKGKQIGDLKFEDAKLFSDESYAAVKMDGKWGFIDKDGKMVSEKRYEAARSFNNGLAAVQIGGKWGFVDADEEIKIEAQFYDAKDFNEKGSCFVKTGDSWQLLKLYRLNR